MKNLLALLAIVALVSVSFAQDLDAPKTGTAQAQQQAQQGGNGSIFDQMLAIMLQKEQAYISGADWNEWNWMRWSISVTGINIWGWTNANMGDAEGQVADGMFAQLSPAEQAAFRAEAQASWNRVIAAGLN